MVTQISFMDLQVLSVYRAVMCPWVLHSYYLGPMLCSSHDVSRLVGNDIRPDDYSNRMLPCSHKFLHELTRDVGKKNSKGLWVLTITLQDPCCV